MNKDFLFACRVCHSPLIAASADRGTTVDCPNCSAAQSIPSDRTFGSNPSTYLSDLDLLGLSTGDSASQRHLMLRRVRLRRNPFGEVIRDEIPAVLAELSSGTGPAENVEKMKEELELLRELLAERDRDLAEWQTCHESVERELTRASHRAASLQTKINITANELAQTRAELSKARSEAAASRKANEALNRQLQEILKAHQSQPTPVATEVQPAAKLKPGHKPPGELAA